MFKTREFRWLFMADAEGAGGAGGGGGGGGGGETGGGDGGGGDGGAAARTGGDGGTAGGGDSGTAGSGGEALNTGDGGAPGAAPAAGSLAAALSEELRADPRFAKMNTPDDLARELLNQDSLIGRKGVVKPAGDAPQEQWDAYYNGLGRPEGGAGDYDLGDWAPPEGLPWDAEAQGRFAEKVWAAGLTGEQYRGVLDGYGDYLKEEVTAAGKKRDEETASAEQALRRQYGDEDYEKRLDLADRLIAHVTGDDEALAGLVEELDTSKFGRNPKFLAAMFKIVDMLPREESGELAFGKGAGTGAAITSPAQATAAVAKMRAEIRNGGAEHPYNKPGHPEHAPLHKRMAELVALANPET